MKKLLFILLFIPILAFADDCSNAYMEGVRLYKSGKYAEAQQKFIAVAKECGNYSDVFKMLKDCNTKLFESLNESANEKKRLATQISNYKNENQQLVSTKNKLDADLKEKTDLINQSSRKLLTLQSDLKVTQEALDLANGIIEQLRSDTSNLHTEISERVNQYDSLKTALDECVLDAAANNNDIKTLKGNLKNAEKEKAKLQKEKSELEKKIESLQKKLDAMKEENDALKHPVKQNDK
jgi:chromosome segregation ATPase